MLECSALTVVGIASASDNLEFAPYQVPYFNSYIDLLREQELNCLYICNALPFHHPSIQLALENHLACVCEKPIVRTLNEFVACQELSKKKNVYLTESMWPLYSGHYSQLLDSLKSGAIGKLKSCEITMSKLMNRNAARRVFNRKLSGGLLYDYAIYGLHFGIALALSQSAHLSEYKIIYINIAEEFGTFSVQMNDSLMVRVNYSSSQNLDDCIDIVGSEGTAHVQGNLLYPSAITFSRGVSSGLIPIDSPHGSLLPQFELIAKEIREGKLESSKVSLLQSGIAIDILEELDLSY